MTFHNEELQKTSSLKVFFFMIVCLAPRKKGLLEERVLLSNNIIINKLVGLCISGSL